MVSAKQYSTATLKRVARDHKTHCCSRIARDLELTRGTPEKDDGKGIFHDFRSILNSLEMPIVAPCAARFACVFNNCATLFFSACPIGEYQTQFLPRNFSGDVSPRDAPRTAGWVCVEFRRKGGVTTWQKKPLRKLRQPQSPLQKPLRSPLRKPLSNQPRKLLLNQPQSPLRKPLSNQPLNQPRSLLRKLLPNRLRSQPRKPLRSPLQKPLSNQPRKLLRSPLQKPLSNQPQKLLPSQPQRKLQPRSKLRDNTRAFARVFFYGINSPRQLTLR